MGGIATDTYSKYKEIFFFAAAGAAADACFSSIARGLLAPGLLGYFLCEQKVPKKSLRKLRFLRTFLNYGGVWLRYDLRISGLSSVPWADAGAYFCAQLYWKCWLPRGTRHEGLAFGVQICKMCR